MKKTIIVNLYGGPGTGKSTAAARIFADLKMKGIDCELVTEYAKDLTWQKSYSVLENQIYILGKQYQRIHRVLSQVDVIITDSPLPLGIIYNENWKKLNDLIMEVHNSLCTVNYFLIREKPYNPNGRNQTAEEATELDYKILTMLNDHKIHYTIRHGSLGGTLSISKDIMDMLEVINGTLN